MTPLPQPSLSTVAQYTYLLSLLHARPPQVLEIDILPSTHGSEIQYAASPPSIGVPKALLVKLYLHARNGFFSCIHSKSLLGMGTEGRWEEALQATSVMLLWDPNHVTAINWRKRCLLALKRATEDQDSGETAPKPEFEYAVQQEVAFLSSLVTSPLAKHTKSSTLWSHRLWLLRLAPGCVLNLPCGDDGVCTAKDRSQDLMEQVLEGYWEAELEIVMTAGERHPRNYYAWQYARDLLRELPVVGGCQGAYGAEDRRRKLASGCLRKVHRWCLQHPRDISGWAFLRILLELTGIDRNAVSEKATCRQKTNEEGNQVRKIIWETKEFVRKYEWRGGSIEWFLKSLKWIE